MLRALGHPVSFLGLLVGFVAAVFLVFYVQAWLARLMGDRTSLRGSHDLRRTLDPFGAVAATISTPGWGNVAETNLRSPLRRALTLLAGPAAAAALGLAALGGYLGIGGLRIVLLAGVGPGDVIAGANLPAAQAFLLCAGVEALGVAVLSLVPLPPLTGWRLLLLASSHTLGWQRARYWLEERNIGVIVLLVLLIIPLGGGNPPLVGLVDAIVRPLTGLLA